jgi:hypothetical protein
MSLLFLVTGACRAGGIAHYGGGLGAGEDGLFRLPLAQLQTKKAPLGGFFDGGQRDTSAPFRRFPRLS